MLGFVVVLRSSSFFAENVVRKCNSEDIDVYIIQHVWLVVSTWNILVSWDYPSQYNYGEKQYSKPLICFTPGILNINYRKWCFFVGGRAWHPQLYNPSIFSVPKYEIPMWYSWVNRKTSSLSWWIWMKSMWSHHFGRPTHCCKGHLSFYWLNWTSHLFLVKDLDGPLFLKQIPRICGLQGGTPVVTSSNIAL